MKVKRHPIYNNISADSLGNIYSNGVKLEGCASTNGYWQHSIKRKTYLTHRLVAECFLGRRLEKWEHINHKNFNRQDNTINNLEVTDASGNISHYWRSKGEIDIETAEVLREHKAGENHHNSKLSQDEVEEMILGFFGGLTNKEASKIYGVHERYVSLIRHKKRWKVAWVALGLEGSTTIPSGSRAGSGGLLETETSLQLRDMI